MTRIGQITVILGTVGAAWIAAANVGRVRTFALAHLLISFGLFAFGLVVVFALKSYHGSAPRYFEMFTWPITLIFAAYVVIDTCSWLVRRSVSRWNGGGTFLDTHVEALLLGAAMMLVIFYNSAALARHRPSECIMARFTPIHQTAITEYLSKELGLRQGEPFRGIAATIDGVGNKASVNWFDLIAYDAYLWDEVGNDHRSVGLWQYDIPTLFQSFTFITPPYYLLLTDFLARPDDKQLRSVLVLTKIDAKMMQLWGTKYVITDQDSGIGREVLRLSRQKDPPLRLLELPRANVGNYSPVNVIRADDAHADLTAMRDPSFDPEHTVLTNGLTGDALVSASAVKLAYERYGFHISAKSDGRSLLILPVQYSHCWTVEGVGAPLLFRANLMQLGVRFSRQLDARLVFRFGPILASGCRLEDLQDMYQLRVTEARTR
jgi:hypothetical protein